MATLSGKTILVVGGSSGIGYGVAKAALLSHAAHVIISSSSQQKVNAAVNKLKTEILASGVTVKGNVSGEVVDARDTASVKALFARVGEIDHLVWTSGDSLRMGFPNIDLDKNKDVFDVRFWGPFTAAQVAKIRPGGSITLTIGALIVKPGKGSSLMAGMVGAVDSLTRGLAVDLAPIRVNVVSPGLVETEIRIPSCSFLLHWTDFPLCVNMQLWDSLTPEVRKRFEDTAKTLLVQHVADADEIAEAYLFLMKCGYITGQRIEVDGGGKFI